MTDERPNESRLMDGSDDVRPALLRRTTNRIRRGVFLTIPEAWTAEQRDQFLKMVESVAGQIEKAPTKLNVEFRLTKQKPPPRGRIVYR